MVGYEEVHDFSLVKVRKLTRVLSHIQEMWDFKGDSWKRKTQLFLKADPVT